MRTIQRQPSPDCIAQQPAGQDWGDFIGTPCHLSLTANLRQEQQGLCCYCESEVPSSEGHIEHLEPRRHNPARCYDYANLALS